MLILYICFLFASPQTFFDFESVSQAMDGITRLYEQKLKQLNPQLRNITYDISDLYKYIDALSDLSCLVFHPDTGSYVPHSRDWIKQRAFQNLKKQAY